MQFTDLAVRVGELVLEQYLGEGPYQGEEPVQGMEHQEVGLVQDMEHQEEGGQDKEEVHRKDSLDQQGMVLVQEEVEGTQDLVQIQEVVPEEVQQQEEVHQQEEAGEDRVVEGDTGLQGKAEQGPVALLLQYWVQQDQLQINERINESIIIVA